jgi:hypothetical protein
MVAPGKILYKSTLGARCFIHCNVDATNTFQQFVGKKKETGYSCMLNRFT